MSANPQRHGGCKSFALRRKGEERGALRHYLTAWSKSFYVTDLCVNFLTDAISKVTQRRNKCTNAAKRRNCPFALKSTKEKQTEAAAIDLSQMIADAIEESKTAIK